MTEFLLLALAMMFMHIFGDYWMQSGCFFANLKQMSWWENNIPGDKPLKESKYKHDYYVGLYEHAFSWAVCITLPLFIHCWFNAAVPAQKDCILFFLGLTVLLNTFFHGVIDDFKANLYKINLVQDQMYHSVQMVITLILYFICIKSKWG